MASPSSSRLAPEFDPIFIWPSPDHRDYLFWVRRDGTIPKNKEFEYGQHYSDRKNYPDHRLVFVSPQEGGRWSKWFYASDRLEQDEYNWSFSQADLGGVKWDQVERLTLYKRSEFKHTDSADALSQGDVMLDLPDGKFPASTFILAERVTMDAPEELKSLYIIEKSVYFLRSTIARVEHEKLLGVGQGSVTTLYYRGEVVSGTAIETLINSPTNSYWNVISTGGFRIGEQLTHRWFAVTTYSSLDAALQAYSFSLPSSVDMDLPDELISITAIMNQAGENGHSVSDAAGRSSFVGDPEVSLSLSESASSECGGSAQPEIIPVIRSRRGRHIPSTAWMFFVKASGSSISTSDLISKLGSLAGSVSQWPLFQPVQHTFTLAGQRGSARAQVGASGSVSTQYGTGQERNNKEVSSTKGYSKDYSTSIGTVVLPPTIHGAITVTGTTSSGASFSASAEAGWNVEYTSGTVAGYSIGLPVPADSGPGDLDPSSLSDGSVTQETSITLDAYVSPTSLSATTPASIPISGKYLVGSPQIDPWDSRWFKCMCQVVDASVFAP